MSLPVLMDLEGQGRAAAEGAGPVWSLTSESGNQLSDAIALRFLA